MIQLLSRLEVADNTGAKKVRMIRRIGQNKKTASVGDIIVCHVKESSTEASVKKGSVVRAIGCEDPSTSSQTRWKLFTFRRKRSCDR